MQKPEQEERITPGPDEVMCVGDHRSLGIITVTANAQNFPVLVFDREPADGLAQVARTEVGLRHGLTDLPGGNGACTPLPGTLR